MSEVALSHTQSQQRILKSSLGEIDQYKSVVNNDNNDFFKSCQRSQTEDWKHCSNSDLKLQVFPQSKHKYSDNLLEVPPTKIIHQKSELALSANLQFKNERSQSHQEEKGKLYKSTNLLRTFQNCTELDDKQIQLKRPLLDADGQFYSVVTEQRSISKIRSNNVKIQQNRLAKISKLNKDKLKQEKFQWSWDTSAALIRLMIRRKTTRVIMNLYIWILLFLRFYYLFLMVYYLSTHEEEMNSFTFFWWVFAVYFGVRILFGLIVLKILTMSNVSNDQKIKIVQQVYLQIIEENRLQLQHLQELEIQNKLGGSYVSSQKHSEQWKIKGLRTKLISLQIMMVIVPPEFSFIFLISGPKQYSGYYQTQNFIMKSLEIFFFVPFLIYFLHDKLSFTEVLSIIPQFKIYYITSVILLVDLILFTMLVVYLLTNNQRKKTIVNNKN